MSFVFSVLFCSEKAVFKPSYRKTKGETRGERRRNEQGCKADSTFCVGRGSLSFVRLCHPDSCKERTNETVLMVVW